MEKRDGFNVGDVVVFNTNLPDNQEIIESRGLHNLNTGLVIVNKYRTDKIDFNIPVFKTDTNSFAWDEWRFTIDKNHIVTKILNDL